MTTSTKIYLWRNTRRGVLAVAATSLEKALGIIETEHPNWHNYARGHKPEEMSAKAGSTLYTRFRG